MTWGLHVRQACNTCGKTDHTTLLCPTWSEFGQNNGGNSGLQVTKLVPKKDEDNLVIKRLEEMDASIKEIKREQDERNASVLKAIEQLVSIQLSWSSEVKGLQTTVETLEQELRSRSKSKSQKSDWKKHRKELDGRMDTTMQTMQEMVYKYMSDCVESFQPRMGALERQVQKVLASVGKEDENDTKKSHSFEDMKRKMNELEKDVVERLQIHEQSLQRMEVKLKAVNVINDISMRVETQAAQLFNFEHQLAEFASIDEHFKILEEHEGLLKAIQSKVDQVSQEQERPANVPRVRNPVPKQVQTSFAQKGKGPMHTEEGTSGRKYKQPWVRKVWLPRKMIDSMQDLQITEFMLEGRRYKPVNINVVPGQEQVQKPSRVKVVRKVWRKVSP